MQSMEYGMTFENPPRVQENEGPSEPISVPPDAAFQESIRCSDRIYYGVSVNVNAKSPDPLQPMVNVRCKKPNSWKRKKTLNPLLTRLTVRQLKRLIQDAGDPSNREEELSIHLFSPSNPEEKKEKEAEKAKQRNYPRKRVRNSTNAPKRVRTKKTKQVPKKTCNQNTGQNENPSEQRESMTDHCYARHDTVFRPEAMDPNDVTMDIWTETVEESNPHDTTIPHEHQYSVGPFGDEIESEDEPRCSTSASLPFSPCPTPRHSQLDSYTTHCTIEEATEDSILDENFGIGDLLN